MTRSLRRAGSGFCPGVVLRREPSPTCPGAIRLVGDEPPADRRLLGARDAREAVALRLASSRTGQHAGAALLHRLHYSREPVDRAPGQREEDARAVRLAHATAVTVLAWRAEAARRAPPGRPGEIGSGAPASRPRRAVPWKREVTPAGSQTRTSFGTSSSQLKVVNRQSKPLVLGRHSAESRLTCPNARH